MQVRSESANASDLERVESLRAKFEETPKCVGYDLILLVQRLRKGKESQLRKYLSAEDDSFSLFRYSSRQ
jgi:hypothetical protein